jgi:hypothetical protein
VSAARQARKHLQSLLTISRLAKDVLTKNDHRVSCEHQSGPFYLDGRGFCPSQPQNHGIRRFTD